MEESYWLGTGLKFAINITADGFDMNEDDFEVAIGNGSKRIVLQKSDIKDGENGEHLLCFDSTQFPSGMLRLVVSAKVPDDDFDDGVRKEVFAMDFVNLKHPW